MDNIDLSPCYFYMLELSTLNYFNVFQLSIDKIPYIGDNFETRTSYYTGHDKLGELLVHGSILMLKLFNILLTVVHC